MGHYCHSLVTIVCQSYLFWCFDADKMWFRVCQRAQNSELRVWDYCPQARTKLWLMEASLQSTIAIRHADNGSWFWENMHASRIITLRFGAPGWKNCWSDPWDGEHLVNVKPNSKNMVFSLKDCMGPSLFQVGSLVSGANFHLSKFYLKSFNFYVCL